MIYPIPVGACLSVWRIVEGLFELCHHGLLLLLRSASHAISCRYVRFITLLNLLHHMLFALPSNLLERTPVDHCIAWPAKIPACKLFHYKPVAVIGGYPDV